MTKMLIVILLLQLILLSLSSPSLIDIDKCTTIITGKWNGPKPLRDPITSLSLLQSSLSSSGTLFKESFLLSLYYQ